MNNADKNYNKKQQWFLSKVVTIYVYIIMMCEVNKEVVRQREDRFLSSVVSYTHILIYCLSSGRCQREIWNISNVRDTNFGDNGTVWSPFVGVVNPSYIFPIRKSTTQTASTVCQSVKFLKCDFCIIHSQRQRRVGQNSKGHRINRQQKQPARIWIPSGSQYVRQHSFSYLFSKKIIKKFLKTA